MDACLDGVLMNPAALAYSRAVDALNRGRWPQALQEATAALVAAPNHPGVHFVIGVASLQLRQMPRAMRHLEWAARASPERPDYAGQFARALSSAHLKREALLEARRAAQLGPKDSFTWDTLGVVFTECNAHHDAAAAFESATALAPDVASYRFNHATSLTFLGDIDAAELEYEACLRHDPRYWKAHLALAQLRRQEAGRNHLDRLKRLLQAAGSNDREARLYINLAIAKEAEDLGDYSHAFQHLVAGKAAGREGRPYSPVGDEALFQAIAAVSSRTTTAASLGHTSEEPVFVIGLPRTGTTLVDRILCSHPDVHSAGELPNFSVMFKRATGSRTAALLDLDTLERSATIDWRALGEAYLNSTRPGTGHTARFVDKLPHNFLYAGFIAEALPKAKIVCLQRQPMDACLANFRQLFAPTPHYDYSFDLLDTGRYYLIFRRLMAHWKEQLGGRFFEIRYEDLVADQIGTTRALLDHCELPWNEACLRFEENALPVATASAVQVRSPIHSQRVGHWRKYEQQLLPLRRMLEAAGVPI